MKAKMNYHLFQKLLLKKNAKLAKEKCLSELKKLKSMSPMSAEATVVRNYLDWMTVCLGLTNQK